MTRFCKPRALVLGLVLALLGTSACSRPAGSGEGSAQTNPPSVPFQNGNGSFGSAGASDASTGTDTSSKPSGLPFRDVQNLPAGTLLTVRLKHPITARNPGANVTFEAVVDAPVVIDGYTVIPRGVDVAGRVESVRTSDVKRDRGYVRLVLDAIQIGGADVSLRTVSLFARGNGISQTQASEDSSAVIRLEKGRRLTFRLAEPLYLASQTTMAGR